jgi:hypothetical protein
MYGLGLARTAISLRPITSVPFPIEERTNLFLWDTDAVWMSGRNCPEDVETFNVEIDDVRFMLIDPPRDIFSKRKYVYMGQSVVGRLLEHFMQEKGLAKRRHKLVLLMPPEKITPNLSQELEAALDRFAATKIQDNRNEMAAIRRRGILQIPYALIFLGTSIGFALLLGSEIITNLPPVMANVLSEGLFIVGWVAMWGPLDTLLFGRFPLMAENRALEALERMTIEIRPRQSE